MNPCNVTVEVFGDESEFSVSSHEMAVKLTDVFQHQPFHCRFHQCHDGSIDTDIDHEVDYSFHETFGAAHGWLVCNRDVSGPVQCDVHGPRE